jgi:hypothetical protein
MRIGRVAAALSVLIALAAGCERGQTSKVLKAFPLDSLDGVLTQTGVALDRDVSSDGRGSLRITGAGVPTTVRLFEIRDITVDRARLTYRARIKTANLDGRTYLEMWCAFAGEGEYFSRSNASPLTGTVDWVTVETPFLLRKGEKPQLVKLNIVVDGTGVVWVDDIELLRGPLR